MLVGEGSGVTGFANAVAHLGAWRLARSEGYFAPGEEVGGRPQRERPRPCVCTAGSQRSGVGLAAQGVRGRE